MRASSLRLSGLSLSIDDPLSTSISLDLPVTWSWSDEICIQLPNPLLVGIGLGSVFLTPRSGTVAKNERYREVTVEKKLSGRMRLSNMRIAGKERQAKQQASSISVHTVMGT